MGTNSHGKKPKNRHIVAAIFLLSGSFLFLAATASAASFFNFFTNEGDSFVGTHEEGNDWFSIPSDEGGNVIFHINFAQIGFKEIVSRYMHLQSRPNQTPAPPPGPTPSPTPPPSPSPTPTPPPMPLNNLIPNGSLEEEATGEVPEGWLKGGTGVNTPVFTYPVTGRDGGKAVRLEITDHTSGDAKWFFTEVPVLPNTPYEFSDSYKSNAVSTITFQYKLSDGTYIYEDMKTFPASADWENAVIPFTTPLGVVAMTGFHLLTSNGVLTTDNYVLKRIPSDPTRLSEGIVTLTLDDCTTSQYTEALPILEEFGFKATFFIVSLFMLENEPGHLGADKILDIQARGHEIGGHTRTHRNLTLLSPEEALIEIDLSRKELLEAGINKVDFFAYPFGGVNESVKKMIRDSGYLGARTSQKGYNTKATDPYQLQRRLLEQTTTFEEVKVFIDTAIETKQWLILEFHEVGTDDPLDIREENLRQILQYLKDNNIPVVSMDEGLKMLKE